jgi:hypothetical protein
MAERNDAALSKTATPISPRTLISVFQRLPLTRQAERLSRAGAATPLGSTASSP